MGRIRFITGGARSGKSRFAEELVKGQNSVLYIATGIAFDDEMKERIAKHKNMRNKNWITVEAYRGFHEILKDKLTGIGYIVLDCITIMVSNIMLLENDIDWDNISAERVNSMEKSIQEEIDKFLGIAAEFSGETIIVSNELGMGIVPPTSMGRYYRDIAGRINQVIANASEEVYFMVSGIPVKIKG